MYFNKLTKQQMKFINNLIQSRQLQQIQRLQNYNSGKHSIEEHLLPHCLISSTDPDFLGQIRSIRTSSTSKTLQYTNANTATTSLTKPSSITSTKDVAEDDDDLEIATLVIDHSGEQQDELTKKLSLCNDFKQIQEVFLSNQTKFQRHHYVESIIQLWKFYRLATTDNDIIKANITKFLHEHILDLLHSHVTQMDIIQLSCCYLYLRKMGIANSQGTLQDILIQALNKVKSSKELVPLSALSRLSVGINLDRDFFTPLVCRHFVPHLEQHVAACCDKEQTRFLATCLFQLNSLVNDDLLKTYKTRVRELLQSGVLNAETPQALLKVIHMLNLPIWSQQNSNLIRDIFQTLEPSLAHLNQTDKKTVCRLFLHYQEPATLFKSIKDITEQLFVHERSPDTLACAVPFVTPQQRDVYIRHFKELLYDKNKWLLPNASGHFFSILRSLKIANVRLCNVYWSGVVDELNASEEELLNLRFLRHCQRYMNFNNNLGGTYRHIEMEQKLSQMAMHAIEYDIAGRIPNKFARLASFILAYGHTPFAQKKFPNVVLSKILSMAEQFSMNDCFILSRGIQIAQELRFRKQIPPLLSMQLSTIDTILIGCAERHLRNNDKISASDLNAIVRALSHRKSLKSSVVFNQALSRYKLLDCNELNTRLVRDMAYNLTASNFLVPEVLEAMFAYIKRNHMYISGDSVEKVLKCAYNLGYTPDDLEALDYAALVLQRDFEHMSGLSLVQACLALCYYKTIPEELINKVFNVKFIQRVEDEIQICYSKTTYPERVLNLVMQLNRTVCLDFPEANVPWFQQNYVEAQLSKKPFLHNSTFNSEVQGLLKKLLKDETYFRCNHTTPYGYQIDFVIHFDRDKNPISSPVETTMLDRITKVAILLMKLDSFSENDLTALRGPVSLKIRHLEMMGYKVLHVNEHDWNSKYLKSTDAKTNYLKCLLQISH